MAAIPPTINNPVTGPLDVWLGVKDVFTQIAKDVVGQGLDHGRRSLRGLIHNQCGVSCGTIACSDVTEGIETQKPVSRMAKIRDLLNQVDLANDREESIPFNVLDATFILEFSSSQMFAMHFRDLLGSTETERNALMLEDFS
ncbi:hypothetical protein F2Q70_00043367 [Brassica cretica]|uniref:Uncharacterized protein n=1 Tax=Brassica cretica TaxID=69181 RepID=A0A8S9KED9_BRACR|nr:hypothetical protein F2Q70_00043367 [Brassica cretica]